MQKRFSSRMVAAILAGSFLLACQKKPPEEELLQKVEPVGSWLASLEMLGRKWAANSIPSSFAQNTLSAARKALDQAAEETAKSEARPGVRAPLGQLVSEAQAACGVLEHGIEAGDRGAVARETGRLAELHKRFESLMKKGGPP